MYLINFATLKVSCDWRYVFVCAKLFDCIKHRQGDLMSCTKNGTHPSTSHRSYYEVMAKGYREMSSINLKLATECFTMEYEAESIVERAVSGG